MLTKEEAERTHTESYMSRGCMYGGIEIKCTGLYHDIVLRFITKELLMPSKQRTSLSHIFIHWPKKCFYSFTFFAQSFFLHLVGWASRCFSLGAEFLSLAVKSERARGGHILVHPKLQKKP